MMTNINLASPGSAAAISGAHEAQTGKTAQPNQQSVQLPQDHVTVSSVGDLVAAALKQPEVRADRVSALKEAIASGTYKVDPHAIASAILSEQR